MQTMTSASCDVHVAELARLRHGTGPGKDIYITAVVLRKSTAGLQRSRGACFPSHSWGSGKIWAGRAVLLGYGRVCRANRQAGPMARATAPGCGIPPGGP